MAGSERRLTVVLAGDAKGLTTAIGKAETATGRFGSKLGGLSGKAKLAMAGAGTAVLAFGKTSIDAFVEAEQSQTRLEDAFAKFPGLAGGNIEALRKLNEQLALKTRFDDDATASGQAVLAQFGLTQQQLSDITPLLQDYAARTGKDLPSAAQDLGKAVLGQGRALKSVGIDFKDTGSAAGNLDQLMGGLRSQVAGFAEKEGNTAAGKAEILKNQFGELQETVGSRLVPALLALATFVTTKVIPAIQAVGSFISEHKPLFIGLAVVIGGALVAAFVSWAVAAGAAAVATLAAAAPVLLIGAAIAALAAGVIYAYNHWGFFRTAVDKVASFFKNTLWPILQAVAGWITGTLVPTVQRIASKFGEVIGFIRRNWQMILGILTGPIGAAVMIIVSHRDKIVGFFQSVPGLIRSAFSTLASILTAPFRAAFRMVKNLWNNTVGGFGFKVPGWVPGVGGNEFRIPEMHTGGIFNSGRGEGLALLKDGEGVFTREQMAAMGGSGATYVFDFRGAVGVDGPAVERWVRNALTGDVNRNGKIPGTNIVKATA